MTLLTHRVRNGSSLVTRLVILMALMLISHPALCQSAQQLTDVVATLVESRRTLTTIAHSGGHDAVAAQVLYGAVADLNNHASGLVEMALLEMEMVCAEDAALIKRRAELLSHPALEAADDAIQILEQARPIVQTPIMQNLIDDLEEATRQFVLLLQE